MRNWKIYESRIAPEKKSKIITENKDCQVVKTIKKDEYEYYECDCCGVEIKIEKSRWGEKRGGILNYPINSTRKLVLFLCNTCLKPTLKELDIIYRN